MPEEQDDATAKEEGDEVAALEGLGRGHVLDYVAGWPEY